MEYTVPTLSIVFMIFSMILSIAIPLALYIVLRKKTGCDRLPFWTGCAVMFVFALILEQIVHSLVLNSPAGQRISSNLWAYGIYGGLMAGLFEESGRYIAFKTVLRKKQDKDSNALMYGAGHGGFEAFFLVFFTMLNNLIYSFMINSGGGAAITGALSGEAKLAMESVFAQLAGTAPSMFLVSIFERGAAMLAQIALSVMVWFAAKKGGKQFWLYPLAILLHLVLDAGAIAMSRYVSNILLLELAVWAFAGLCALIAVKVWKKNAVKPEEIADENGEEDDGESSEENDEAHGEEDGAQE